LAEWAAPTFLLDRKEELFRAVVNAEMELLSQQVGDAVGRENLPEAKLRAFVLTRMRVVRELASVYATLHEEYLDQLGFVERFREDAFRAEVEMIRSILEEGVKTGAFEIADVGLAAKSELGAAFGMTNMGSTRRRFSPTPCPRTSAAEP